MCALEYLHQCTAYFAGSNIEHAFHVRQCGQELLMLN